MDDLTSGSAGGFVNGRKEKQDSSPEGRSRGGMCLERSRRIWGRNGRARAMVGPVDRARARGVGTVFLRESIRRVHAGTAGAHE